MKQTKKSDSQNSKRHQLLLSLENAQQKSLDDCALALQSIVELEKLALETNQPNIGNIQLTKKALWDAMVYLAIFASRGLGCDRIKVILSKYGLEDQF